MEKGNKYKGYEVSQSDIDSAKDAMEGFEAIEINRAGDTLFNAETQFRLTSSKLRRTSRTRSGAWRRPGRTAKTPVLADLRAAADARASDKLRGLELLYDKNQWRNWPFLDFISPSIKVRQVVVDEIHDNWNFDTNVKVDRCITCHLGVGSGRVGRRRPRSKKYGIKPYMQAHPGLKLIAGTEAARMMSSASAARSATTVSAGPRTSAVPRTHADGCGREGARGRKSTATTRPSTSTSR